MSETEAIFAERTIRSVKIKFYRFMGEFGNKYIHTLSHFITTLFTGKIWSIVLLPKKVKIPETSSILYSQPLREYSKPKFHMGDRNRIWKSGLTFGKGYKPEFAD